MAEEGVAVMNLADIGGGFASARRTRTIGFVTGGAAVLSWTADQDYDIIYGVGASGVAIFNFSGGTYVNLSGNGTHLDWIALVAGSSDFLVPVNQRLSLGQLVYFSAQGIASGQLILAYLT